MKKILKNKKGFTLVELLAVIVVLAIIMVIATQTINNTIKKSRADSFVSSYTIVLDAIKLCKIQNLDGTACEGTVDLSADDYVLDIADPVNGVYGISLSATGTGEFANMDLTAYYQEAAGTTSGKEKIKASTTVSATEIEGSY